jgi:hypothetical protein
MIIEEGEMEQQHERVMAATIWEADPVPGPPIKFDNRAYLMAAHEGWAHSLNRPIAGITRVEEQVLPYGHSAEYQATTGSVKVDQQPKR